jgi:hypothetical protein
MRERALAADAQVARPTADQDEYMAKRTLVRYLVVLLGCAIAASRLSLLSMPGRSGIAGQWLILQ